MNKRNRFKLAVMAGTCVVCVMVPATMVFSDYSDTLSIDSHYGNILDVVSRQDTLIESDDDILLEDNTIIEEDDILISDSGEDDVLLSNDPLDSYDEIITDDYSENSSDTIISEPYDPFSIEEDIILTKPVRTTPTPTPKPSKSKTVKGAMGGDTDTSDKTSSTTAADGTAAAASTIDAVIKAVNARRQAAGVAPLTADSTLNYVATQRVKETTRKFSHTRPNGKESVTILSEYGVSAGRSGENIACCISSPEGVVSAWANSPSHNRCMLNSDYTKAGVGTIVSDGCTYWVLLLTN